VVDACDDAHLLSQLPAMGGQRAVESNRSQGAQRGEQAGSRHCHRDVCRIDHELVSLEALESIRQLFRLEF
jgi:hypothetical protein